ncbi:2-oxoacid:acceptor oxidoreductase subunit alpha [Eubacteriaceae bacterium ES2]|nr:2-oxoacid:acceptor oxidoreductase subunit alpha [Eubacteriaceae bacterium ES2]
MYNILIGGAAGQGLDTMSDILEKLLKKSGYNVFTSRDFMSRIRGGHNFMLIRFSAKKVFSHSYELDGIIAFNEETIDIHQSKLNEKGFILCDSKISTDDQRAIKIPMDEMAKELGNSRVAGTIGVGAIMKIFSCSLDEAESVLESALNAKYLDINMTAIKEGQKIVESRYPKLEGACKDWMIIKGSQAVGLGAIAAGLNFYTAYPMSPSTPIMVYVAEKSEAMGIVLEQAEDEIAAINMALGASYAGARAMTATSGGGFALMVEAFGLSGIAEIPLVLVNVQRPGPATGFPTRTEQADLKFMISAAPGEFPRLIIAPRNHDDAFYQTIRAFDIADRYQIPVVLLMDQFLGDASATVEAFDLSNLPPKKPTAEFSADYLPYQLTENGISPRPIPGQTKNLVAIDSDEHDETGKITESAEMRNKMMKKRMGKLDLLKAELQEPELIGAENPQVLLLGWGSMYGSIVDALDILNSREEKYGALVFGDVFPLPESKLKAVANQALTIINVEQNYNGQLAELIREKTGINCSASVLKYDGRQFTGQEIADQVLGGGKID